MAGISNLFRDAHDVEDALRANTCARVGANIYGRAEAFLRAAEKGNDALARAELQDLLRYFPKKG